MWHKPKSRCMHQKLPFPSLLNSTDALSLSLHCIISNLSKQSLTVQKKLGDMDDQKPLKLVAGADSFGCALKDFLVQHLQSKGIEVQDLGTDKYYCVGAEVGRRVSEAQQKENQAEIRGLVACGTGAGVSIFANKFPGVYSVTCASLQDAQDGRSINNSNVIAVGAMHTTPEEGKKILDVWLETPFKAPCPASEWKPWPPETADFLENSLQEIPKIPQHENPQSEPLCVLCSRLKNRKFENVEIVPGASMSIVRESPTAALVNFKAGSIEPAHHHSHGHDLYVVSGSKKVWNLSKNKTFNLGPGDYLYTPAPDVHRVHYLTDTEFFIRWDGDWDIFQDEDLATASDRIKATVVDLFPQLGWSVGYTKRHSN